MRRKRKHDRQGEGSKFTLDRKIFSSDIWFASPWKLKIWIYLIGHANHKDSIVMGIPVKRGQLIRSYRKIAEDCTYKIGYRIKKPSLDTIKRVCDVLEREGRIVRKIIKITGQKSAVRMERQNGRRSERNATLFLVCNYNDLQAFPKPRTEQQSAVRMEQDKNVNKEYMLKCFERFWEKYPKKVGKKKAREKFLRLSLDEERFKKIMEALEIQKKSLQWKKDAGQYIPHPATWIHQERWEDETTSIETNEPMRDFMGLPLE